MFSGDVVPVQLLCAHSNCVIVAIHSGQLLSSFKYLLLHPALSLDLYIYIILLFLEINIRMRPGCKYRVWF